MKDIDVNKKDVIWGYIAQFLSMGTGVITLPFILNHLSADEIGLNYIFITISGIVALVDLGFAPQFARNFSYIFSGAKDILAEGIAETDDKINYKLLKYVLASAKHIYGALSILSIVILLFIGTPYVYEVTHSFTAVPNCPATWVVYSAGIFFQVYFTYYSSMLIGAGLIKEQKYTIVAHKVLYMVIVIGCLYMGLGLMSVALGQLIAPFAGRWLAHHYFYTPSLRKELAQHVADDRKIIYDIFRKLWYNAKRNAVISVGAYAILRLSMFIAGFFLSLAEFGSYGLMVQLTALLGTLSCTYVQILQPKLASLRAKGRLTELLVSFSRGMKIYYLLFVAGSIILIFWGEPILGLIKSNAVLPSGTILTIYCIVMFLEYNHANFSILISSNNHVPFAPASIITGTAVVIGVCIVLKFTTLGILGLILVQGLCQLAYQNWKWPYEALKEYKISFIRLMRL